MRLCQKLGGGAIESFSSNCFKYTPPTKNVKQIKSLYFRNPRDSQNSSQRHRIQDPKKPNNVEYEREQSSTQTCRIYFHADNIIEEIDYIIFIDSDDYWERSCLKSCVGFMQDSADCEIVWFDWTRFYDDTKEVEESPPRFLPYIESLRREEMSSSEFLAITSKRKLIFAFAHQGMINFAFLRASGVRFLEDVLWEDVFFGFMLFASAKKIGFLNKKLYAYRIRQNSISRYTNQTTINSLSPNMREIYEVLGSAYKAREYYKFQGVLKGALLFAEFIAQHENNAYNPTKHFYREFSPQDIELLKSHFLAGVVGWAISLAPTSTKQDVWHMLVRFKELLPYLKGVKLGKASALKKFILKYPFLIAKFSQLYALKGKLKDALKK